MDSLQNQMDSLLYESLKTLTVEKSGTFITQKYFNDTYNFSLQYL